MSQEQTTDLAPINGHGHAIGVFESVDNFEAAQRMAKVLAASSMVPKEYQGNLANCVIALELAARMNASPFMIMQNLDIIHGRPSLRATFLIGTVNTCGRYTPLGFEWRGNVHDPADSHAGCRAVAADRASGQVLEGTWITWQMVKGEGWLNKNGSKWKTLPEQMFRYRAAAFWCRAYAPEVMLGMSTSEETSDVTVELQAPRPVLDAPKPSRTVEVEAGMGGLAQALKGFEEPKAMSGDELEAAQRG